MSAKAYCPHCHYEISEKQLKSLWAEYCGSKTSESKRVAAQKNGTKGGRPITYFQTMYDSVPSGIAALSEKLEREDAEYRFPVERVDSPEPQQHGFAVRCLDITWHCFWESSSDFVRILENGKRRPGINRVNYAANRAAAKLVQDIHREQLMRMPEDSSRVADWI